MLRPDMLRCKLKPILLFFPSAPAGYKFGGSF